MPQLKFKDIVKLFDKLKEKYSIEEIMEMPIYLGDDVELDGVHYAMYCEEVNKDDDEEIIEMIDRNKDNKLKDKAILIS